MGSQVGFVVVRRFVALLALVSLIVGLTAMVSVEAQVPGTISGTITDEVTGAPIEGVRVIASRFSGEINAPTTFTDPAGYYEVAVSADTEYTLRFTHLGDLYEEEFYDDQSYYDAGARISFAPGSFASGIDAALTPIPYFLDGTVTDSGGQPLTDIEVSVYARYQLTDLRGQATTDSSGRYVVTGLGNAYYDVVFEDPGGVFGRRVEENVRVRAGGSTEDATLAVAGSISGRAVTELADPIAGLEVTLDGYPQVVATTAADGTYQINGLDAGDHTLYFNDPSGWHLSAPNEDGYTYGSRITVAVAEGEHAPNADITMILGVRMSGTVTDVSGSALEDATVSSVSWLSPHVATSGSGFRVTTDATGDWSVTAYPGAYGLVAEYSDGATDFIGIQDGGSVPYDRDWATTDLISALGGSVVEGVEIVVAEATPPATTAELSGVVTDPDTGDPVANVSVRAYDDIGEDLIEYDITSLDGSFQIEVAPGDYRVSFSEDVRWWWDGATSVEGAAPIVVAAGDVLDLSCTVPPTARLTGTVEDGSGATVFAGTVSVVDQSGGLVASDTVYPSNPDYELVVVAGTYDLEASAHGYLTTVTEDVTLSAGSDTPASFVLAEAGSIRGYVTHPGSASNQSAIQLIDIDGTVVDEVYQYPTDEYELRPPASDGQYYVRAFVGATDSPWYGPGVYGDGSGPTYVSAAPGEIVTGIDIDLGEAPRIEIRLEDESGTGLSDNIFVYDADSLEWLGFDWVSAGDGLFVLWPGDYLIGRDPYSNWYNPLQTDVMYEFYDDATSLLDATRVEAVVDATTSVHIVYGGVSSVNGSIVNASESPQPGAVVVVRGPDDRFAGATIADANGEYWWPIVVPGDYTFEFRHPSYATEWWQDSASLGSARRLTVGPGETLRGVDVVLGGPDPQYPPPNLAPEADDASFSVDEDAGIGAVVGTVAATDPEDDPLTFSIASGNTGAAFDIDNNGVLSVDAPLDYETTSSYYLEVIVSDGGLQDTAWVSIDIGDVYEPLDNQAPVAEDASFSVAEDAPLGSTVGTVDVSDPDLDTLNVSVTAGNAGGAFAVDDNGVVTVAAQLDYESHASYTLTVLVSDGSLTDTATVTITVIDVVEPPDNTAPSVGDAAFSVSEDAAVGSIVGTVTASDPDDDPIAFSITAGNTADVFAIDGDGVVTVAATLDYETLLSYSLTVLVSDGFLTDDATVTVTVVDVDENPLPPPPEFTDVDGIIFLGDIQWLAQQGITKGCNPPVNDMFCPNDYVTRGQMAAFLVRALGLEDRGTVDFLDDDGSVFEPSIEMLAEAGITRGCNPPENTMFCPSDYVTRGQMAAFLVRALGLEDRGTVDFLDDDGSVFEPSIEMLATAGITKGCNPPDNTMFCPDARVTRGQMAAFLHRALGDG